ncbi:MULTISPECIES: hypothetical protein [Acidiphilium]|uniref:t-SNARE coiled-coil homology domain-containing protein n=1 Tax=Acidiphilium rubrum TaxID=526 RepID=A0A8G2FLQ7_ACIRU|nr:MULTISPECIES: hypothetical protein [Acidiphilium]SIR47342.1 hypothetical protein SAMN05421828_13625 [Acidiphilium rubrum]
MDDIQQRAIQNALAALAQGQTETATALLKGISGVHETVRDVSDVLDQQGEILTRIFAAVAQKDNDGDDSLAMLLATLIKQIENQMVRMTELSTRVMVRLEELPERLAREIDRQTNRIPAE